MNIIKQPREEIEASSGRESRCVLNHPLQISAKWRCAISHASRGLFFAAYHVLHRGPSKGATMDCNARWLYAFLRSGGPVVRQEGLVTPKMQIHKVALT